MQSIKDDTKILFGHKNQIKSFDLMTESEPKMVHNIQINNEDNDTRFKLMSDDRLIIADRVQIITVDQKDKGKVIAKLEVKHLYEIHPFFMQLQLIDGEKYLIALTLEKIHKLSLTHRKKIEQAC